ncbi:hypothetical protein MTO96_021522 [Rhipicephalus appendiculatus]
MPPPPEINITLSGRVKSIPPALKIITPFRLARLVLYRCNFEQIRNKEDIPHMRYLKQLDFVHVPITGVHVDAFDLIPDVESISLVGTQLASIPKDNPWDCGSCLLNNLHDLLNSSARPGANYVVCKEPERYVGLRAIDVEWNADVCGPIDFYAVVWVPLLLTTLTATVISYVLYTKRWYMMYALLYLRVKVKNYKRQSHCGRFMWDAFLCYHVSDGAWARDVLLAKLESPPMRYRVCVAERDFIPGIPITENICRCISQSRVSLFVLSAEFCRSRWCMFEMMLAQHRLFESDRDEHIVLIKKGPIDESQMCPILSYLTTSRTYIDVSQSESDERLRDIFWLQLQAALQQ